MSIDQHAPENAYAPGDDSEPPFPADVEPSILRPEFGYTAAQQIGVWLRRQKASSVVEISIAEIETIEQSLIELRTERDRLEEEAGLQGHVLTALRVSIKHDDSRPTRPRETVVSIDGEDTLLQTTESHPPRYYLHPNPWTDRERARGDAIRDVRTEGQEIIDRLVNQLKNLGKRPRAPLTF